MHGSVMYPYRIREIWQRRLYCFWRKKYAHVCKANNNNYKQDNNLVNPTYFLSDVLLLLHAQWTLAFIQVKIRLWETKANLKTGEKGYRSLKVTNVISVKHIIRIWIEKEQSEANHILPKICALPFYYIYMNYILYQQFSLPEWCYRS